MAAAADRACWFREADAEGVAEMVFQGGVAGPDAATVAEQHPAVDGQPTSVEGLHLFATAT
jgi:hypothetical protein